MGTWGPGAFESDEALESRDSVIRRVNDELGEWIEDSDFCWEEIGSVLGLAEVLSCLVEGCGGEHLLDLERARAWREKTVTLFEGAASELGAEFVTARRKAIQRVFRFVDR